VNNYRWFNPSLPQTLQTGIILLYVNAFFFFLYRAFASPLGLLLLVGFVAGAFGIANEKKWGYFVGLGAAVLKILLLLSLAPLSTILSDVNLLLDFLFSAGLVALLAHPMSRQYQKIWFR
jgi:hypothetical protein